MKEDIGVAIKDIDQRILAHSGVDSYEEIIKLLVLKLYDEQYSQNELSEECTLKKANIVLQKANEKWPDIVSEARLKIGKATVAYCLKRLKKHAVRKSHTSAFDVAIEYLLPHTHRGNRGQFMTPRHIAHEIIKMVAPKRNEFFIDPACGSGGFLEYAILEQGGKKEKYAGKKIYGTDYDERMTRIARLVCLKISGEEAHISTTNALTKKSNKKFDLVVANPPYGGLVSEKIVLHNYQLAKNTKGEPKKTQRHILFIEKCIHLAKPGGRIALILPQGVLNNARMGKVHEYIFQNCRLLAVISLPQSTFMPHTNVKTSVVILEKWKKNTRSDYDVFMAIAKKSGKDTKGKYVYKGPEIDHDLKKIREDFQKFKKSQNILW